ncbi:CPBP family intramembrane glutamic endopeptidase [Arthrobacter sp.]|uniref:CPBP family intramembrane glutamic endopeptidase n=1 Tax=Arthrobacter sp. TaxID=1667 RepID=UPI0026DEDE31|nr:CPBP family intramembrane glutamic endopeptidase [Arthrobacter sp.]MDO5752474.1 CPBP family intramembrane metalloprotease [Arthrobacter sp.]
MSTTSSLVQKTRPYLALLLTTAGLVVFLGAVGTVSYLLGFTGYLPLVAAFIPLAAATAIGLTMRRSWRVTGFRRIETRRPGAATAMVLVAALPIAVIVSSNGVDAPGVGILAFAGLAILVGFVEESIFRGILLRLFSARAPWVGVVATSVGFAVAHSAAALSPEQSITESLATIVFAFFFGVIACTLVRMTGSIWPAIALHVAFDFSGFVLVPRSAEVTDLVSVAVAAVLAVVLVLVARRHG